MDGPLAKSAVTALILAVYAFLSWKICSLQLDKIRCYAPIYHPYYLVQKNATALEPEKLHVNRFCGGGQHGTYCLIATIIIGANLMIFRLLRFFRTRFIKFLHLFIHGYAFYLILLSIRVISIHENGVSYGNQHAHKLMAFTVAVLCCVQVALALIIFVYIYPNCRLRQGFAGMHDIHGIFIFLGLVGCCINGKRYTAIDYTRENMLDYELYAILCFILVPFVVCCPLLEWELNGPL